MADLTLIKIITLALADAVNPCEFAVMLMVLVSILIANPGNKKKVLYGGFAFTLAIFIGYFFYGLVMIQLFKGFKDFASSIYPYISNSLALFAIFLGLLNVKDFLSYKPGGFATEMPLKLRPKLKIWIEKITGTKGAFFIGLFVTIFLLPCTMGPYLIASGSLSGLEFIKTLPWLLIYNLIFVSPMIIITLLVYFGLSSTEELSDWKDRKIRYIHLIAGLLLIGLGIAILTKLI